MEFDRRTRYSSTGGAATHDAPTPGKQTLTQGMVQMHLAAAPSSPRSEASTTRPSLPVPTGPRPTLQMLFGRRGPVSDPEQVHATTARGTATAATQLPHLEQIQRSFGRHDVSGVQAHTGGEAAASAQEMGAAAYATGNHVVLGAGTDLHTVAHEAAHVVQQRAGVQLKGRLGALGDTHEQHADAVADRVVRGESAEALLSAHAGRGGSSGSGEPAVQRKPIAQGGGETYVDDVTGELFTRVQSDSLHGGRMQLKSERRVVWFYDQGPTTLYVDPAEAEALEDAYHATQAIIAKRPEAKDFDADELFAEALDIAVFEGAMNAAMWLEDYGHAIGGSVSMQRHGIDEGHELEREFSQLAAVARPHLSAMDLVELRDQVSELAAKDGVKAAIDWIKDVVKVRQQLHAKGSRQQPKDDPGPTHGEGKNTGNDRPKGEGDRDDESSSSEGEDEGKWHGGGRGTPGGSPNDQPDPRIGELAGNVPTEVWQLILWFMSRGNRGSLTSMRLVSKWFYSIAENTTTNEIWYGLNSVQNNRTRWNTRPVSRVDPLNGRINQQRPGEYREGPCAGITGRIVAAMTREGFTESCMVGALLGMSGRLYITCSGIVPPRMARLLKNLLPGVLYQLVETAKLTDIRDDGDELRSITNVKTFRNTLRDERFYNHPISNEYGEVAKAPPGTCALPKLIEACREKGDTPKYMSEKRFAPRQDESSYVRVLNWNSDDEAQALPHGHGESTPSCVNCRPLTTAQLEGVGSRENDALNQHHERFDLRQSEQHERERERQRRDESKRSEQEEAEQQRARRESVLRDQMRAKLTLGEEPETSCALQSSWAELGAWIDNWIGRRAIELSTDETANGETDSVVLKLKEAINNMLAALGKVDPSGEDGWLEANLAEVEVLKLLGRRR